MKHRAFQIVILNGESLRNELYFSGRNFHGTKSHDLAKSMRFVFVNGFFCEVVFLFYCEMYFREIIKIVKFCEINFREILQDTFLYSIQFRSDFFSTEIKILSTNTNLYQNSK